eukprot:m.472195 g.472195  ORF g.472195 m.472195 type:complete len:55 (-) comp32251_c0_seq1:283-447(-)
MHSSIGKHGVAVVDVAVDVTAGSGAWTDPRLAERLSARLLLAHYRGQQQSRRRT